jgi:hypothetical protein
MMFNYGPGNIHARFARNYKGKTFIEWVVILNYTIIGTFYFNQMVK